MPYTFAHIGYILPIKKKWSNYFSTTGLVFGSLAPDYDILFRLTNVRYHIFQYNLQTIFLLIFPLALLSAILFHSVCRNILIQKLPDFLYQKYKKYSIIDLKKILFRNFIKVSTSILFAILLHLGLDFLCHILDAYAVKIYMYNFTDSDLIATIFYYLSIYLLPILFSILGFYFIYKYEFAEGININKLFINPEKIKFYVWILIVTIIITLLKLYFIKRETDFFIDLIAISLTSSFIMAIYIVCFGYFIFKKWRKVSYG